MTLAWLTPRARRQGECKPKHSGFLFCKLFLITTFVSSNISGRVEGQDLNPCDILMKPSHYTHACQPCLGKPCLSDYIKQDYDGLSYATQVDLPSSCLVCGKTKDRQMLALVLPSVPVLFPISPQLPCST